MCVCKCRQRVPLRVGGHLNIKNCLLKLACPPSKNWNCTFVILVSFLVFLFLFFYKQGVISSAQYLALIKVIKMQWKCDILETKCYRFLLPLHQFDTQLPLSPHWHASLLLCLCEVGRLDFHTNTLTKPCARPNTRAYPHFTHTN